ncbi:hypothetical protein D5F52_26685 (plasmid) [Brevibacillus laterosporus]|uniref:MinD/ParA family ATP-binding protein n=1 Tax=Brevibacillus laterosporus TaxID=1465 RepID=UPI000E6C3B0D|nr:hypothetical protein [Brevibacillus laterosporus]AYB41743.1 hypothetical protein D5F52_26685 [Brevibacillus laterosporus]
MIINASKFNQITILCKKYGYSCEEKYDLGNVTSPVILSDQTDVSGEVANTLASNGIPVLYLAYQPPTNISPSVSILKGEEVVWEQIQTWIDSALLIKNEERQIANLKVKRTIGFYGIQPGVGSGSIARGLALKSALSGKKTLYIDFDIRFPKAPFLIGFRDVRYTLEGLIESILTGDKVAMEPYFLHKSKMENVTKKQQEHFKKFPENFFVLSPSSDIGIEYFPDLGTNLDSITELIKNIVDGAKPFFENIIFSMGSDPDEPLNIAILRACDQRILVTDTSPSGVSLFKSRRELLHNAGVPEDGTQVILSKVPQKMDVKQVEEILGQDVNLIVHYDPNMISAIQELNLLGGELFHNSITNIGNLFLDLKNGEKSSDKRGIFKWLSKEKGVTSVG